MASAAVHPYGYKINFLGIKEVHEERAAVVRLIYKKYIEGMNRYAITWYLINHKILRPRGDSCDWQYSMVVRILADERYVGNEKYQQIIAKEIFEAAQEVRRGEQEKAIAVMHESCNSSRKYPFSGFIKCDSCGSNYIRGIQNYNSKSRKATWRCMNYKLKHEGKCKASGNIYEEVLEIVCVEAYNLVLKDYLEGNLNLNKGAMDVEKDKSIEMLIKETIHQMKGANEKRLIQLQSDLNMLINKQTTEDWKAAPLDLSNYETEKIKSHFQKFPIKMQELEIDSFKEIFSSILALEPGKIKMILKNGNEIYQEYKPMRGQISNAKKCGNYSRQTDK